MSTPALPAVALHDPSVLGELPDLSKGGEFWVSVEPPHTFAGPEVEGPSSHFLALEGAAVSLPHPPLTYTHWPSDFLFYISGIILVWAC